MRSRNYYRGYRLPALSLRAFNLQCCDTCHSAVDRDDMHRDESGTYCQDCRDEQIAEMEAEFSWMRPHIERAAVALSNGAPETYEAIKHDVLRHDSPFDPHNRRSL